MRRAVVAVGAVLVLLVITASVASAHALLQSAEPAPNSVTKASPPTITLTFTEAPDPKLSSVQVLDSSGASVATGRAETVAGHADELTIAIKALADGVYTVAWRTVSAEDGHVAAGSYAFSVGSTPPPAGSAGAAPASSNVASGASLGAVIARWILYLGLLGLLGAAFLGAVLLPGQMRLPLRLALGELAVAILGTVLLVAFQAGDAGASLADLPGTSLGNDVVMRLVPLAFATAALVSAFGTRGLVRRGLLAATGVLAAAALLVEAVLSHAASQAYAPAEITLQWLHVTAVGLWLGGLLALLTQLRGAETPAKRELARRFALLAGFGLGIVALTGLIRSIVDIGTINALLTTEFGLLVLLKVALLIPIAALGALNHFRNVPRAGRDLRPLWRAGSIELTIGAAVLLVASILVNVAPPTEVAAAAGGQNGSQAGATASTPPSLTITGSDFGTSVRLKLTVSPGRVGSNDFTAQLNDYDTGAAVSATAVRLSFSLPSKPSIGASTLDLRFQEPGLFTATGANLSLAGTWLVAALVTEPSTSVEVDLQVAVRSGPQQIDINRVAGLPTIYTVHLGSGRTVQVYLDPGTPGPNLLHATWFDATGHEMPVSDVTMAQILPSGASVSLQPKILDSGHEAASVQVASLPATFGLAATGPGGVGLQTQLQISQSS
jgi:copper transport protein